MTPVTQPIRTPEFQTELAQLLKRSNDEPFNVDHWWLLGEFFNRHHESDEALKYFEAVLKHKIVRNPKERLFFQYHLHRAFSKAYAQKKPPQYEPAITHLQQAMESISNKTLITEDMSVSIAACQKDKGLLELERQQYSEAVEDFSLALHLLGERMPSSPFFSAYQPVKINTLEHRALAYMFLAESDKALLDLHALLQEYAFDLDKFSEKRASVYFQIGHLHSNRRNDAEAISYYQKALDESKRSGHELDPVAVAEIWLQFSLFYYKTQDYGQSISYADASLKLQGNNAINLALLYRTLSRCCLATNEVDGALTFSTHALSLTGAFQNTHPFDFAESCAVHARACFLKKTFDEALTYFEKAFQFYNVSFEKHKAHNPFFCDQVKMNMAEVQASMGDALFYKADYKHAVAAYKVALNEKSAQTSDNYFKHGFCLHALGQLDKAVIPYREAIKKYGEEKTATAALKRAFVLNQLGTLYHKKKQTNDTRKSFKLALAGFENYGKEQAQEDNDKEMILFQGIELYLDRPLTMANIHLHLADLCVAEEKFIEAEPHYLCAFKELAVQTADNDRKYADCCVALKKSQEAITHYTRSIEKSKLAPENQTQRCSSAFALGQLYLEQDDFLHAKESFLLALGDEGQAEFIQVPGAKVRDATIHLYLGDIYARQHEAEAAQLHYLLALEEPCLQIATVYYKLWSVYYRQDNQADTVQYFKQALPATRKSPPNDAHHQELVHMALEEIHAHDREAFDIKKYDNVIVPPIVKVIFQELKTIYPHVYLGGSAMHALLMGQPLNPDDQDLDFFVLGKGSNRLNEELNFHTCAYNPSLYIKKSAGYSVDCYVTAKKEDDFTIANLYCDEEGKVHDFGKWGVDDFFARRLSMVSETPEVVFQQKPVSLLRAIKYKIKDFRSTAKLQKAIIDYVPPTNNTQNQLLYARMRIMLKSLPTSNLITWLKEDRLLEKLFGVDNQLPAEEALTQLKGVVRLPTSSFRQSQSRDTFLAAPYGGSVSFSNAVVTSEIMKR